METRLASNRVAALKLRHFEVLLAIARHRSIRAAADALTISQPAVSQLLADIESALGAKLFERERPLRTTAYAEAVLRYARRVLNDAQRTQDELEAIRAGAVGRVRIGVMPAAISTLMPQVVRALCEAAPTLSLVVVEDIWAGLWRRFERAELELLIGRPDRSIGAQELKVEMLYDDPHVVICGIGHPLAKLPDPAWKDLQRCRWILPPAGTPLFTAIGATLASVGSPPPEVLFESASHNLNFELLRENDTIAVAPRAAARLAQARGLVHVLPLELSVDIGPLGMVWNSAQSSEPLERVVEAVRKQAAGKPGGYPT